MNTLRSVVLPAALIAYLASGASSESIAADPATKVTKESKAGKEENPYLAGASLSRVELGKFLDTMRRKPDSIRQRPGFAAALVNAADRILSGGADDDLGAAALLAKFAALDDQAQQGDKAAGNSLLELATERQKDSRESIALEAQFHLLQRRAQDSAKLDDDELAELLKELKQFFGKAPLDNRHLNLASLTVGLVNRLDDDAAARSAYQQFGALWAKSKDPQLAKYGKKIEKGPAVKESSPKKAAESNNDPQPEDSGGTE